VADDAMLNAPRPASVWLAGRSIAWAALLPGVVAGYVPWRYFGLADQRSSALDPVRLLGAACAAGGVALLVACIWQFAHSGRGTLAPLDPPRRLVLRGPYRHVRNPMYLGVTAILLGETLWARSPALLAYGGVWFAAVNVFVFAYEEPTLRRRFGASYDRYSQSVGRWIPGRRAPLD
jgi:protein-S-isoprenylcysteine O-methyltransferase Ste14